MPLLIRGASRDWPALGGGGRSQRRWTAAYLTNRTSLTCCASWTHRWGRSVGVGTATRLSSRRISGASFGGHCSREESQEGMELRRLDGLAHIMRCK
ncbi:hypothetical protein ACHAWF_000030 [Thalassiosira exigua]